MPNSKKNQKPSKPAKAAASAKKAPAKPVKATSLAKKVAAAAVKKLAPLVAPKKGATPAASGKKKHEAPKKHAAPAKATHHPAKAGSAKKHEKHDKHEKHEKHAASAKSAHAPAPAAKEGGKRRIVGAAPGSPAKDGKKGAHLKVVPQPEAEEAPVSKKKAEVVVEVPAPKGVAILRGGKPAKKGKAESPAALGKKRCREPGCDHELLLSGYCRLHYIKNWRKIKRKEAILASGQLNNYVEELVNKYPDKYLDVIRQDLASEKEWAKVVIDLELESADEEGSGDEDLDATAEGVSAGGGRGFDDDSDAF